MGSIKKTKKRKNNDSKCKYGGEPPGQCNRHGDPKKIENPLNIIVRDRSCPWGKEAIVKKKEKTKATLHFDCRTRRKLNAKKKEKRVPGGEKKKLKKLQKKGVGIGKAKQKQ